MSILEPGRPACDFSVVIVQPKYNGMTHFVPAESLQDVYDIAINSMDFGSGFLSTEEVRNLRILGRAIGAEPLHYKCGAVGFCAKPGQRCTSGALE